MNSHSDQACPLTGQLAQISDGSFDGWTVTSPYTDGTDRIAKSAIDSARTATPEVKAKVVSWIVDQHRAGELEPLVGTYTFDEVRQRSDFGYEQKVDRFFQMLSAKGFDLSSAIKTAGIVDDKYNRDIGSLTAWLGLKSPDDVHPMLRAMTSENLLEFDGTFYRLTAEGIKRLDRMSGSNSTANQAFVAMWFSAEMDSAYENGFEPAILDNGFQALRIDKKEHSNKIDDEIISEIRKSRFVVADFTCEILEQKGKNVGIPRGGVYYEAGFAQGLNIDVIWTVRADCIDHVHFDTRQYSHVVWNDPEDLREKLRNRIGAVIGKFSN